MVVHEVLHAELFSHGYGRYDKILVKLVLKRNDLLGENDKFLICLAICTVFFHFLCALIFVVYNHRDTKTSLVCFAIASIYIRYHDQERKEER